MTSILYHCKICHTERSTSYDEACPISKIELWKKNLCCNRCYKFYDDFNKARRAIVKWCRGVELANTCQNQKTANETLAKCRQGLVNETKRLSRVVCDYYNLTSVWDMDFVDQLLQNPIKCNVIVKVYHSGIRQESKNAHSAAA